MKGYTSAVTSSASEASLASSAYWSPPPSLHLTPTAGSPYPYPFPLPTLKSVCLIYVAAGFVYLFTMHHNDNLHFADPRPPLRDFMFSHLPHSELAGSVCDIFATVCIFGVAGYLLFTNDTPAFRWGLLDLAVGKVLSLTLHTSTLLPESRPYVPPPLPVLGNFMGGSTDRLMSNHVFELGVALHIAQGLGWVRSTPERLAIMAVFSAGILVSRGHYTVDVVLAWWCMAAVGRVGFTHREKNTLRF